MARKRFVTVQLGSMSPQPAPETSWRDLAAFLFGVFVGVVGLVAATLLIVAIG